MSTPLPALSQPDADLLAAYIRARGDMTALLSLTTAENLTRWINDPAVRTHVAIIDEFAATADHFRALQSRTIALGAVEAAIAKTSDPTELRRHAAQILALLRGPKAASGLRAPRHPSPPRTTTPPPHQSTPAPRATAPDPERAAPPSHQATHPIASSPNTPAASAAQAPTLPQIVADSADSPVVDRGRAHPAEASALPTTRAVTNDNPGLHTRAHPGSVADSSINNRSSISPRAQPVSANPRDAPLAAAP